MENEIRQLLSAIAEMKRDSLKDYQLPSLAQHDFDAVMSKAYLVEEMLDNACSSCHRGMKLEETKVCVDGEHFCVSCAPQAVFLDPTHCQNPLCQNGCRSCKSESSIE